MNHHILLMIMDDCWWWFNIHDVTCMNCISSFLILTIFCSSYCICNHIQYEHLCLYYSYCICEHRQYSYCICIHIQYEQWCWNISYCALTHIQYVNKWTSLFTWFTFYMSSYIIWTLLFILFILYNIGPYTISTLLLYCLSCSCNHIQYKHPCFILFILYMWTYTISTIWYHIQYEYMWTLLFT